VGFFALAAFFFFRCFLSASACLSAAVTPAGATAVAATFPPFSGFFFAEVGVFAAGLRSLPAGDFSPPSVWSSVCNPSGACFIVSSQSQSGPPAS